MSQSHFMLVAGVILGGCAFTSTDGDTARGGQAGEVADLGTEPVGNVQQAYGIGRSEYPPLDPECPNGGNHTVHNPGFPAHERGPCAAGGGFGIDDAVNACGGAVKYYSASCDDFAANAPYQPFNERAWTVYVGCCADAGPRPRPIGPGPNPIGPGPGPVGPGPGGHGFGGPGSGGPGLVPVPVPVPVPAPVPGHDHGYHGTPSGDGSHPDHQPPT